MNKILRCPGCNYSRHWKLRRKKRKCKKCKREFSPRIENKQNITKQEIQVFLEEKIVRKMAKKLDISLGKAQKLAHKCRTIISEKELPPSIVGPVEVDETYVGAQRKNKKLHIRRIEKSSFGMGTKKLPIFGIYDRNNKYVYVNTMKYNMNINTVIKHVVKLVPKGTKVYTDGCIHYRNQLPKLGYDHEFVDHSKDEYVRGEVHTNCLDGFWGIMKRKMGCIGGMKRERLHLFAKEIAWRQNYRHLSLEEQTEYLFSLFFS